VLRYVCSDISHDSTVCYKPMDRISCLHFEGRGAKVMVTLSHIFEWVIAAAAGININSVYRLLFALHTVIQCWKQCHVKLYHLSWLSVASLTVCHGWRVETGAEVAGRQKYFWSSGYSVENLSLRDLTLFSLSFSAHNNTLFYNCVKRPSSTLCRLRRFKIMSILHTLQWWTSSLKQGVPHQLQACRLPRPEHSRPRPQTSRPRPSSSTPRPTLTPHFWSQDQNRGLETASVLNALSLHCVEDTIYFNYLIYRPVIHLHSPSVSRSQFQAGLKTHLFRLAFHWPFLWELLKRLNWTELKIIYIT